MTRNLSEYPITQQEVVSTLLTIRQDILKEQTVGDLRAHILGLAAAICSGQHIEDALGSRPMIKPVRKSEYKVCLSCNMTGGRHDPDCPYDGKTHLPKPKQEMDDNW